MQQRHSTLEKTPSQSANSGLNSHKTKSDLSTIAKYWWLIPVLGIIIAIAGVSYVRWRDNDTEETTTTEISPLSVRTTAAVREPIQNWISNEGTVRAVNYKHLAFEVEGDVTYLADRGGRRLREGDRVTKGELLATVDERELLADVSQAQAAIAEAQQNRAAAAAQVSQAQAQAQAQLQQARSQVRRVEAAQEQYKATQSAITTAEARLSQAEVALEGARLYAPFDGIVAYLNLTKGEYYSPQIVTTQLAGDYQGILDRIPMVIIDPAQYEVITDLAGSNADKVQTGQNAVIAAEGNIQQSLGIANTQTPSFADSNSYTAQSALLDHAIARGEVFAVNPAISPGGRAIEATIRLFPDTSSLKHGEQVTTWIAVEATEDAVVVPLNAIVYRDRIPYVFVVNSENIVEQRQVQLGIKGIVK